MSRSVEVESGPNEGFLDDRFAQLQAGGPDRPVLYRRMLLIKTLREERGLSAKQSKTEVDLFLRRRGLGVPQPSLWFSAVFGVLVAALFLVPIGLFYLLWRLFAAT